VYFVGVQRLHTNSNVGAAEFSISLTYLLILIPQLLISTSVARRIICIEPNPSGDRGDVMQKQVQ
jgi:hypothetical protein